MGTHGTRFQCDNIIKMNGRPEYTINRNKLGVQIPDCRIIKPQSGTYTSCFGLLVLLQFKYLTFKKSIWPWKLIEIL